MVAVDNVIYIFQIVSANGYFVFLLLRFVRECIFNRKAIAQVVNDLDIVAVLAGITVSFRAAMIGSLRSVSLLDRTTLSDVDVQVHVRTTILLEVVQIVFGALSLAAFINTMVKTATGANLFQPIKIGQRIVDPGKALKLFRLFVLLMTLTTAFLFGFLGLNGSYEDFVFYRRLHYLFPATVSVVVSMPLLTVFGSKVIRALEQRQPELLSTVDKSKAGDMRDKTQKVWTLRVSFVGVMLMYAFTAINFISVVVVNEVYMLDHRALLLSKVCLGSFYWLYFTWYLQ
ncbi:hypothetical protein EDD86DRAFT_99149 [Gorgonomyces haynaldii]|nr:hypothetical protein EDD86DRAFT_99149 [Gorgonomyces haynaldii]